MPQAHSSIFDITPYIGGDVLPGGFKREVGLCSNENPFGTSPKALEAIARHLKLAWQYPSGSAHDLKNAIAQKFNLDPSGILCGNGSEELLHLIARCFVRSGDEVVIPQHAFNVFRIATLAAGGAPVMAPRENYILHPHVIDALITRKTKVIFMDHPGNPVGNFIEAKALKAFIERLPASILLVLDCAYAEFLWDHPNYDSGLSWVKEHKNLIITRTFSKAYGFAGLRLGWLYTNETLIDPLNRVRAPFNVNRLAQIGGVAALDDDAFLNQTITHTHNARDMLEKEIQNLGFSVIPCCSNFVMMNALEDVDALYQYLGQRGVIVRPMKAYQLPTFLRISIGTDAQLGRFLELLKGFKTR